MIRNSLLFAATLWALSVVAGSIDGASAQGSSTKQGRSQGNAPAPAGEPGRGQQARAGNPAGARGDEGQPGLLGQFGDWGAYAGTSGGRKVCFALAKPASSQTNPAGRPRDPAYIFVSTRPAEKVQNEISVIIGYTFRPNADAVAEVGPTKFAMQTQNDGGWLKNAGDESRMIDAMRRSPELVVRGVSGRGTQSIDRYSLRGLSQALDRVTQECR